MINLIDTNEKLSMVILANKLNELIEAHNELAAKAPALRDRGPASEREMTMEDAVRCIYGDHKDSSHKVAAEALNLSYGQIYSARKGYTFKAVDREAELIEKWSKAE